MESPDVAIKTLMYVVGIQTTAIIALGRYVLKLVDDCSNERKDAWNTVKDLTTSVTDINSVISREIAVSHARDRQ